MGIFTIPEDAFFTHSPQISIRCQKDDDVIVLETSENEGKIVMKGAPMNCFERPGSDQERNSYEARLKGVVRMDTFLRRMGGKATVQCHGKVCIKSFIVFTLTNSLRKVAGL